MSDLKRLNNTVIVIDYKSVFIQMADYLVEIRPGAGKYGGHLLYADMVEERKK